MRGNIALFALIWVCIGARLAGAQLEAAPPASGYVPPELAARVATRKAQHKWGSVTLGPVLPTCNADGESRAYLVCFALGGKPFPSEEEVTQNIREGRALYEAGLREGDREKVERGRKQISGADSFATVVVSATRDHYPIPAYGWGLPRYFTIADLAEGVAREALGGGEARVSRIFFGSCAHQVFEFTRGSERVLVDADRLRVITRDDLEKKVPRGRRPAARPDEVARAWADLENVSAAPAVVARSPSDHWVQHPGWVPFYPWTQGCSPTSAAMAMAYWDNSEVAGGYCGYGLLVKWYQDALTDRCDPYHETNNPYHNVPNLLLDLRTHMGTDCDGVTKPWNIGEGIEEVTYDFHSDNCWGLEPSWIDDYCWGKIKDEINANRPFVWSTADWHMYLVPDSGHSVCALGYTDDKDDKYVIVHDPNDTTTAWAYYYNSYAGGPEDAETVGVDTVEPAGGSDGDNIRLGPRGGQTLYACQNYQINWTQSGTNIAKVDIYYSTEGGPPWQYIYVAGGVPSHEGLNSYSWKVPNKSTDRARIYIRGLAADGLTWIAADGSYQNFTIAADTSPPPAPSFKINGGDPCTGSKAVELSISCAPDCYVIRFSNDGTTWSDWYACGSTKSWTLTSGYGPKTVYAQCQDVCGNIGPKGYDDILYNLGPNAPSNLTATTEASTPVRIRLNWQDNSTNETGFKIFRADWPYLIQADWQLVGTVGANVTTWTDTTVVAGSTYLYRVRAYSTGGCESTPDIACGCTVRPPAPTLWPPTAVSPTRIDLNWGCDYSCLTGFTIWRKTGLTGTYSQVATVGRTVPYSWSDTSVTAGNTYCYKVQALSNLGASPLSSEACAQTIGPTAGPSNLAAKTETATRVYLAWKDNSTNESGFKIERKTGLTGAYSLVMTVGANVTTWSDTSVVAGKTYCYRVRAYVTSGLDSASSNEACASTAVPAAPSLLRARILTATVIGLTWQDNSTNENAFKIERKIGTTGTYSQIAAVRANATTWSDTTVSAGKVYFYRVRAYLSGAGDSAYSNEAIASTRIPASPGNLRATTVTATRIDLIWTDRSSNETAFKIERKIGTTGTYGQIAAVGANATTWSDTTVSAGNVYCYRVRAYLSGAGNSAYSNEACASTAIPAAPTSLTAKTLTATRIDMAWKDNSTNETGFKIERKTGVSGAYSQIALLAANLTTWADTTVSAGITYCYRVRAYLTGAGDSAYSNEACACTAIPAAPTGMTATAVSGSQINLSWKDNSANETGFKIWRKVGTGGSWAVRATVGANVTSYQDTGLAPCTLHTYGVVAYNACRDSGASNAASATTPCVPIAATNMVATAVSGSQINLSWKDNSTNETGFKIWRKVGTSGSWVVRATVGANVTSYQDTGLVPCTLYTYGVVAYNSNGDSTASNAASATTPCVPMAPTNLTARAVSSSQINLSWKDNSTNETGFRILRKVGTSGSWAVRATVGTNVTSYQDTGLARGTLYTYGVIAYNSNGNSGASNAASATTPWF
jgi:fibronectin type 3 domain-containing protein